MIQRRKFLLTMAGGLAGSLAVALPAMADPVADVVAQLTKQGFTDITVTATWLGRIRILSSRDGGVREIVLNPRSGEILRDIWTAADGTEQAPTIVDGVNSGGSGSGGNGSGGDDGSDGSGDDSGSGGSGSGGSGSGGSGSDSSGSDSSGGESGND